MKKPEFQLSEQENAKWRYDENSLSELKSHYPVLLQYKSYWVITRHCSDFSMEQSLFEKLIAAHLVKEKLVFFMEPEYLLLFSPESVFYGT